MGASCRVIRSMAFTVTWLDSLVSRLDSLVSRLDSLVSRLDSIVSRLDSLVSRSKASDALTTSLFMILCVKAEDKCPLLTLAVPFPLVPELGLEGLSSVSLFTEADSCSGGNAPSLSGRALVSTGLRVSGLAEGVGRPLEKVV